MVFSHRICSKEPLPALPMSRQIAPYSRYSLSLMPMCSRSSIQVKSSPDLTRRRIWVITWSCRSRTGSIPNAPINILRRILQRTDRTRTYSETRQITGYTPRKNVPHKQGKANGKPRKDVVHGKRTIRTLALLNDTSNCYYN